jgi:hypothetical protein
VEGENKENEKEEKDTSIASGFYMSRKYNLNFRVFTIVESTN